MLFDYINNNEDWKQFFFISCLYIFYWFSLYVGFKKEKMKINLRQAFLLTILSWLVIALFGSLPFIYSSSSLNFTNAFFESVSGITTTGSTVISNLDRFIRRYLNLAFIITMVWRNWNNCISSSNFTNITNWRNAIITYGA